MNRRNAWPLLAAASLLAAPVFAGSDIAAKGAELLLPFKQDMKAALVEGLAAGPAAAIDACRVEAPGIARKHSTDGVKIGRTSDRLRNPANAGPDWVTPTLERWLANPDGREPVVVELDGERVGYVEPIVTQPMCLACHGETLSPAVADTIERLYPEDRATGFAAGDLRGVFWVEFTP